jgi:hypothetical protein
MTTLFAGRTRTLEYTSGPHLGHEPGDTSENTAAGTFIHSFQRASSSTLGPEASEMVGEARTNHRTDHGHGGNANQVRRFSNEGSVNETIPGVRMPMSHDVAMCCLPFCYCWSRFSEEFRRGGMLNSED